MWADDKCFFFLQFRSLRRANCASCLFLASSGDRGGGSASAPNEPPSTLPPHSENAETRAREREREREGERKKRNSDDKPLFPRPFRPQRKKKQNTPVERLYSEMHFEDFFFFSTMLSATAAATGQSEQGAEGGGREEEGEEEEEKTKACSRPAKARSRLERSRGFGAQAQKRAQL